MPISQNICNICNICSVYIYIPQNVVNGDITYL